MLWKSKLLPEIKENKIPGKLTYSWTDAELDGLARELESVVRYVDSLSEVDIEGVEPMSHVADFATPQREDAVTPSLPKSEALKNAPNQDGDFFVVPKVK